MRSGERRREGAARCGGASGVRSGGRGGGAAGAQHCLRPFKQLLHCGAGASVN